MEELEQLVETAKQAVPGVDAAIAAAIERKVNPVSAPFLMHMQKCTKFGFLLLVISMCC